jgi:CheY-like chemotaxis protein
MVNLPRRLGAGAEAEPADWPAAPPLDDASRTILVVEDDDGVRAHSCEILTELGYHVLEAANAQAALEILDRRPEIALLFTDVGLPGGMNGRQLAEEARRRRPDLAVLYTTGYTRNAIVHGGRLDPGVELITKPFSYASLAAKVRDLLERAAAPPCILLVEDEALVRMVTVDALRDCGFRVEEAASATEALAKVGELKGRIDAAIIDVGLPDRRGDGLAVELRALHARLPIVIASGYGDAFHEGLAGDALVKLLGKPYDSEQLSGILGQLGVRARS